MSEKREPVYAERDPFADEDAFTRADIRKARAVDVPEGDA